MHFDPWQIYSIKIITWYLMKRWISSSITKKWLITRTDRANERLCNFNWILWSINNGYMNEMMCFLLLQTVNGSKIVYSFGIIINIEANYHTCCLFMLIWMLRMNSIQNICFPLLNLMRLRYLLYYFKEYWPVPRRHICHRWY